MLVPNMARRVAVTGARGRGRICVSSMVMLVTGGRRPAALVAESPHNSSRMNLLKPDGDEPALVERQRLVTTHGTRLRVA
ncbi:hypothetical protein Aph02nite_93600 [Actinoplanes philippinensis]|nr:hypothetical protein Aph02nite_93600 [Actinoplanes philippinensis]